MNEIASDRSAPRASGLSRRLSTALVIVMLAGLGFYGHRNGWKLPKFSLLVGTAQEGHDDWCAEHGVPESQCVECNKQLLPPGKDYGWCKEHGIHNCPWEHPDVAQLKQIPTLSAADRRRAARALACIDRRENNGACKNYRRRIQFASAAAVKKAGVDVALVDRQSISDVVLANGVITYDQNRFASLASRLPGTVWRIEKRVGDPVHPGELLALIDAAEVGRAKTELIQAMAEESLRRKIVTRMEPASSQGAVPERQTEKAEAEFVQAQARLLSAQQTLENMGLHVELDSLRAMPAQRQVEQLRWLGLPESIARQLGSQTATANLLPLTAPLDGVVVTRNTVAGEMVDSSRVLFQVADVRRMWLTLSVPLEDIGKLALGQEVRFRPDGSTSDTSGKLTWISTSADRQSRLVSARAELPNAEGRLRSETFGAGRIILREEPEAIVVPNEALHWEGCCHVVFVRDKGYFDTPHSPKAFHVREIRPGASNERYTEVIAGLLPGEVVATKGSDVLRAELLKNNLGEGCCCGK